MLCTECGMECTAKTIDHKYIESGLDNVTLKDVVMYRCSCGHEMLEISNIEGLHRAIGLTLIQQKTLLTAPEIKYLQIEMGLKGKELAEIMGVTKVAVSRWINGKSDIDKSCDRMLRLIYLRKLEKEVHTYIEANLCDAFKEIKPASKKTASKNIPIPMADLDNYLRGINLAA